METGVYLLSQGFGRNNPGTQELLVPFPFVILVPIPFLGIELILGTILTTSNCKLQLMSWDIGCSSWVLGSGPRNNEHPNLLPSPRVVATRRNSYVPSSVDLELDVPRILSRVAMVIRYLGSVITVL